MDFLCLMLLEDFSHKIKIYWSSEALGKGV